jgi:putative FmdB family regulatory protein
MPTYEYRCQDCGWTFEKSQSMKDKPLEKCPKCTGRIQRLIGGGGGIIFKGSGFYTTDYARRNSPTCGRNRPCCGHDILVKRDLVNKEQSNNQGLPPQRTGSMPL